MGYYWYWTPGDPHKQFIMITLKLYTGQTIIIDSTYTGVGETDERQYGALFIVVDVCSEVSCGARNDKSSKAGDLLYIIGV